MASDNITSSSVPSSSCTVISKRRRLDECEVDKQQKDEKLKSDVAKAGTSEHDTPLLISSTNISFILSAKLFVNSGDEPCLRLCLRLPNGTRETISICATDTIEVSNVI